MISAVSWTFHLETKTDAVSIRAIPLQEANAFSRYVTADHRVI